MTGQEDDATDRKTVDEYPSPPYDDADLSALPDWWRHAVLEHRRYGLRPYRPPRFEDGVLKYEVVTALEARLGVDLRFVGRNAAYGDDWTVEVNGEPIGTIARYRDTEGYSVYEMGSDEFVEWVESAVE